MRTLTPPTIVEKNRRTGASFTRILQIHWDGPDENPVYYGDADGTLPGDVPVLGRVRTWGPLSLQAEPGRIGGHQQIQIELQDPDHALLTRMKGDFVDKRLVRIFLWFHGTSWATDKVCLFAGTINGNIAYNDTQATWQFSVKGAESLYDKTLGIEINRKSFPQILCNQCSGQIIPIVFGANVRRIPCCPLGRPPATMLTRQLNILDDLMFLSRSVADMGLEFETVYTVTVGFPDAYETFTIAFHETDQPSSAGSAGDLDGDSVAQILSRSSTLAAGTSIGPYGENGLSFFTIDETDLPEPDRNLMGFILVANLGDDGWNSFVIDQWIDSGNGRALVIEPENLDFTTGQLWKILSTPGTIPQWPVGTPVNVGQDWTFCVSHLPLASVDLVEVRGKPASGANQLRYYELAGEDYTVTLDNKTFNASLGRESGDPGVTTVSISFAPSQWGGDEDVLYITATAEKTAPIEILTELLQNEWLGNIDPAQYPVDLTGAESDVVPAFAITQPAQLHETVSDLAQQFGLLLFWDAGKVCLRSVKEWSALGTAVHTLDVDNFLQGSFGLTIKEGAAETNRLVAKWKPSCSAAKEFRYIREAPAAIEIFGEKTKEMNFWALQDKTSVGDMATFWLRYWLGMQREVKLTGFLDALQVQPADTVQVTYHRPDDDRVIIDDKAVVTSMTHTPGDAMTQQMETIELTTVHRGQEWSVSAVPDDQECSIENGVDEVIPEEEHDNDEDTGDIGFPPWPPGPDPGIPTPNHPGWPQPPGSPDTGGGTGGGGGGGGGGGNYGNPPACHCPGGGSDSGGSSVESSGGSSGGSEEPPCACSASSELTVSVGGVGSNPLTGSPGGPWSGLTGNGQCLLEVTVVCTGEGEYSINVEGQTTSFCNEGLTPPTVTVGATSVNSCSPLDLTATTSSSCPACDGLEIHVTE